MAERLGSALRAFMVKEVHHILRDRRTLTVLLLMPLVQVVLFGYALRNDVRDVRMVIVDPAPSDASLRLRARFEGTRRFHVVRTAPEIRMVEPLFERGQADLAVVLRQTFSDDLARGTPAQVMVVTDAADPNTASMIQAYSLNVLNDFERDFRGTGRGVRLVAQTRMRFNPTLESVNLFVPGLIALVLTLVGALMTALALSREKERGTLEILLVSPLRPHHIIVGKVLPYLGLGMANALTALAAAWLVFRVPFRGSVLLLLAESVLFTMVALALGVFIAARTSTQLAAMLGALLGTMLPNTLLSGMVFPLSSMPKPLQIISNIVPARWYIDIARGIMLKGVGIEHLWPQSLALVAMLIVLLALAVKSFKPRLA